MEKFGETPSTDTKIALANSLIQTFPCLRDSSDTGRNSWSAKGRKAMPSTGFLEERLRNIRKRLRAMNRTPQVGEDSQLQSRSTSIPASPIPQETAEEMIEWLRHNLVPSNQLENYMEATAVYRAEWLRKNTGKSIAEALHEFPRLLLSLSLSFSDLINFVLMIYDVINYSTSPPQIAQDFEVLYKDTSNKMFDIRSIMSATSEGRAVLANLDHTGQLIFKERRCLVRILVSHIMEKFGETPSTDTKIALANSLIQTFPCLRDSSDTGRNSWSAKGRKAMPSTGFLEERLRNIRKRLRAMNRTPQVGEDSQLQSRSTSIPASPIPQETAEEMIEWLRHNLVPSNQLENYMEATAVYRAEWLRKNTGKSIAEALHEFPRLLFPGMIAQDFEVLYKDTSNKMFVTWRRFSEKLLHVAQREGKLHAQTESLLQGSKDYIALRVLPSLMPPAVFKIGRKTVRTTICDAMKAFINLKPVGTNMVEYLQAAEQTRAYPYTLVPSVECLFPELLRNVRPQCRISRDHRRARSPDGRRW
ncbi:unnamed protein product [Merluccius merluccius]